MNLSEMESGGREREGARTDYLREIHTPGTYTEMGVLRC